MPNKEGIRNLFDNIAPEYDRLNHVLSLDIDKTWRRRAVRRIVSRYEPLNILDIASGTGDFAIAIAKKAAKGSRVTGLDISEGMLAIGREKVAKCGLSGIIGLETGDSEKIPYAEGTFDRVSVAFGVRNFEHIGIGLSEMRRVLRKGGTVTILELSEPQNRIIKWLYRLYFLNVLPMIGGKVSGNRGAYEYLPASVQNFPKPARFMEMMSEAGFSNIRHNSFTFGICRMYTAEKQ
ncbi:MAG: bifunctional demethylmenaquinone methyltransferase/2-methoxy-6-polyprenyl-1,4-benzoquinol methylase UbiE [Bacteroidales bacterium]|nr:bifunctional demethylmenaquinone methyltransferase/2-methoxy-6-polyprenyl-1,4-benzoquinol methylase UbiE [Bacteroidales bacterium]MDE7128671.1 bifunctional demethylmenaquinone methyltransferase/2-methoxy-6-polyprenyl-1,4-benzoquinol methylase UbiE [Bacteroidales bacterium]